MKRAILAATMLAGASGFSHALVNTSAGEVDRLTAMAVNPATAEQVFTGRVASRGAAVAAGLGSAKTTVAPPEAKLAPSAPAAHAVAANRSRGGDGCNDLIDCIPTAGSALNFSKDDSVWARGGKCLLNLVALPVTIAGHMYVFGAGMNEFMVDSWLQITPVGIAADAVAAAAGALVGTAAGVWGFLTGGLRF